MDYSRASYTDFKRWSLKRGGPKLEGIVGGADEIDMYVCNVMSVCKLAFLILIVTKCQILILSAQPTLQCGTSPFEKPFLRNFLKRSLTRGTTVPYIQQPTTISVYISRALFSVVWPQYTYMYIHNYYEFMTCMH